MRHWLARQLAWTGLHFYENPEIAGGGTATLAPPPSVPAAPAPAAPPAAAAPAAAPPATPPASQLPQGSPVSEADLYVQQQAAAAAAAQQVPGAATPPPAAPGAAGAGAAAAQQQAAIAASAREYAERLGLQGARQQFADDGQFIQWLVQQQQQRAQLEQQLQQIQPYAHQYMTHAADFQRWQEQQRQAQQQPAQPAKLFSLPEWNPAWNAMLTRDAQGNLGVVPGADPAILAKYHAHQHARKDLADRLLADPEATLAPLIEQRATGLVEKTVTQRIQAMQEQTEAQRYVDTNRAWIFQRDQQGTEVVNPATGQPVLSATGQRFHAHLQAAERMGITNPLASRQYAEAQVRAEIAAQHLAALNAQRQGQQGQQQVIDANRQPNQAGSFHGFQPGGQGQAQNASLSLKDQLNFAMQQAGITDQHITGDERV